MPAKSDSVSGRVPSTSGRGWKKSTSWLTFAPRSRTWLPRPSAMTSPSARRNPASGGSCDCATAAGATAGTTIVTAAATTATEAATTRRCGPTTCRRPGRRGQRRPRRPSRPQVPNERPSASATYALMAGQSSPVSPPPTTRATTAWTTPTTAPATTAASHPPRTPGTRRRIHRSVRAQAAASSTMPMNNESGPRSALAAGTPGAYTTPVHQRPATIGARVANTSAGTHTSPGLWRSRWGLPPSHRVRAAMMAAAGSAFAVTNPAPHAETARSPVITRQAAAWASRTASTTPGKSVQKRSPARAATHHTIPSSTGRNTTYAANGQTPASSDGTAPDQPTRASRPVGSSTA